MIQSFLLLGRGISSLTMSAVVAVTGKKDNKLFLTGNNKLRFNLKRSKLKRKQDDPR